MAPHTIGPIAHARAHMGESRSCRQPLICKHMVDDVSRQRRETLVRPNILPIKWHGSAQPSVATSGSQGNAPRRGACRRRRRMFVGVTHCRVRAPRFVYRPLHEMRLAFCNPRVVCRHVQCGEQHTPTQALVAGHSHTTAVLLFPYNLYAVRRFCALMYKTVTATGQNWGTMTA